MTANYLRERILKKKKERKDWEQKKKSLKIVTNKKKHKKNKSILTALFVWLLAELFHMLFFKKSIFVKTNPTIIDGPKRKIINKLSHSYGKSRHIYNCLKP